MIFYLVPGIPGAVPYSEIVGLIQRFYPMDRYLRYLSRYIPPEEMHAATAAELSDMYHEFLCEDLLLDPEALYRETGIRYVGEVA